MVNSLPSSEFLKESCTIVSSNLEFLSISPFISANLSSCFLIKSSSSCLSKVLFLSLFDKPRSSKFR